MLKLDQQSLWSLPVPIYGEEKVIVKEVTVPVEVVKEVAVPVEHVVTKEVHVPVEIGMLSETRVGESRVVIGEETRASAVCFRVCMEMCGCLCVYQCSCVGVHACIDAGMSDLCFLYMYMQVRLYALMMTVLRANSCLRA